LPMATVREHALQHYADDNAAIGAPICIMDWSAERVVRSPLIQLSRSPMCRSVITEYGINNFTVRCG
ncbi:hypothetical protein ABMA28_015757, partial [Loxostege sticticalis]